MALLDRFCADGFVVLQWANADEAGNADNAGQHDFTALQWRHSSPLTVVKVLRAREDFLPGHDPTTTDHSGFTCHWIRDVDGKLEAILNSANARGVVLRPDHYVLTYIAHHEAWPLGRLDALFHGYGVA